MLGSVHGVFMGKNMIWTQARRYGVIFGWKMSTDPGLVIWAGPRSEIPNGCEIWARYGVCVGNFWSDPGSVMWLDVWLENPNGPKLGFGLQLLVGNFEWTPDR